MNRSRRGTRPTARSGARRFSAIHAAARTAERKNQPNAFRFNPAGAGFNLAIAELVMASPSLVTSILIVTIIFIVNGGRLFSIDRDDTMQKESKYDLACPVARTL